ncbi:MAG: hypothetical protein H6526_08910 [Actinobacteria bacterium]|nr:hypothetical protein [Actinomycetota bacterium]
MGLVVTKTVRVGVHRGDAVRRLRCGLGCAGAAVVAVLALVDAAFLGVAGAQGAVA